MQKTFITNTKKGTSLINITTPKHVIAPCASKHILNTKAKMGTLLLIKALFNMIICKI
jgi:hypothetical protein